MKITAITKAITGRRTNSQDQKTPLLTDAQSPSGNTTSPLAKPSLFRIPALHCGYLALTNNIRKSVQLIKTGTPQEKEKAANALGILAHNTQNQNHIAQAGAIPALVTLLNSGTDKGKAYAAFALGNLAANNPKNQNAIAQADAIPALATLLIYGTRMQKEHAANALGTLAHNTQNQGSIQALGFLVYGRDRANSFADMALNKVKFSGTADVSLLLAHLLFDQTAIGDHLRKNFYQDKFQVKLRDECKKLDPNILLFDQITIGEFLSTGGLIQRV